MAGTISVGTMKRVDFAQGVADQLDGAVVLSDGQPSFSSCCRYVRCT